MSGQGQVVVRAAYDIGSGLTKVQVAEVDLLARRRLRVLHTEMRQCLLREAMAVRGDGSIGQGALRECAEILREMKAKADSLRAEQHAAIATAVFRDASDGKEFLESTVARELGIATSIVSQQVEGEIGYLTALVLCNASGLVVWDSGGGSFQLSTSNGTALQVWGGGLGSATCTEAMVEVVQGRSFAEEQSPNPCTLEQCIALGAHIRTEISPVPAWLPECLSGAVEVVGIGGKTGAFGNCAHACGASTWSAGQLWSAIQRLAGSSDKELRDAGFGTVRMILPKLVLVHTIMSAAGVPAMRHLVTDGGCAGMLLCNSLWPGAAQHDSS